jgi:membrane-associated phospholipid phosphatase
MQAEVDPAERDRDPSRGGMTDVRQEGPPLSQRVARLVTEALAPIVLIVVVTLAVAVHSSDSIWRGILLAAVAIFFAGALPYSVLIIRVRRGRLGDRHLVRREERPAMMVIALASVGLGLAAMRTMNAPTDLYALVVAMTAGVAVALAVSIFWKISIHSACIAGTVVVLAALVNPWLTLLAPLVALTAWARVSLGDHTPAQVAAGLLVGSGVAAIALLPFIS